MKSQENKMHEIAAKNPSFIRSNEYIQFRMFRPDLNTLLVEMGPKCNLHCFHCSLNCGPDRKGLPDPKIVKKVMPEICRVGITKIALTMGEPLLTENREVLREIGRYSFMMPISIPTNGTFARSLEDAIDWFRFMKKSEYCFQGGYNNIDVSFGKMYPTNPTELCNVLSAAEEVFPKTDAAEFISFSYIGSWEGKEDVDRINNLIKEIYRTRGCRRSLRIISENHGRRKNVSVYPKKGKSIKIDCSHCSPKGRAMNLKAFDKHYPIKEIKPEEMCIPRTAQHVVVFYNGDVSFSNCDGDPERNLPYGNVKKDYLGTILDRMRADCFFQAYKLGGNALLYYAAQQVNPQFKVMGRCAWSVSQAIFRDRKLVDKIREYLTREGIVDTYKEYMEKTDMRKKICLD